MCDHGGLNYFKYQGSCLSDDGAPQGEVELRVGEGLKNLGTMKQVCFIKSVSLSATREVYEKTMVPMVKHAAETWRM